MTHTPENDPTRDWVRDNVRETIIDALSKDPRFNRVGGYQPEPPATIVADFRDPKGDPSKTRDADGYMLMFRLDPDMEAEVYWLTLERSGG